jgi:hypothetical protein
MTQPQNHQKDNICNKSFANKSKCKYMIRKIRYRIILENIDVIHFRYLTSPLLSKTLKNWTCNM